MSVVWGVDDERDKARSLTLFTPALPRVTAFDDFRFCCSISVAGESDELEEDDDDEVADFCGPWFNSCMCLSSSRMRSSNGIRAVESSSSLLFVTALVLLFGSIEVSCFVVVEGLFKPRDECFRWAFGLSTTRTFDAVAEVLMCSKANCGNGKRMDSM